MQRLAPFVIAPSAEWLQQHPHLTEQSQQLAQTYEKHEVVEDPHLRVVGESLWKALPLCDALGEAKRAVGQQVLPIIIESSDAAVLSLPWEVLHHPHYEFLGRSAGFTLLRRNPDLGIRLPEVEKGSLRILLFTSLPDDLTESERLDVEAEQAAVQEALMECEQNGEVVLEMSDDGRFDTFRAALRNFRPHLVYLSGHGLFTHEYHNDRAWGSFLFEDEWGGRDLVKEDEIAKCFQNTAVQLLVISACQSAKQHPNYSNHGLCQTLYQAGVPHVIGMRESVFDKAGIQFAKALLKAVVDRQPIDIALQTARAAIVKPLTGDGYKDLNSPARPQISNGQWCLPQLLSHDLGHNLIDWNFTPQPRKGRDLKFMLKQVSVPERFIGRRHALRQWQNKLRSETLSTLLITGAGGIGKTALAGKLIDTLRRDGYEIFTFSVRPEHEWQDVCLDMKMAVAENDALQRQYQLIQDERLDEAKNTEYFLELLLARYPGKLALFFDNLESQQEQQVPHAINDSALQHWIMKAHSLAGQQGLKLILTSRWRLPDWPDTEHYPLGQPVYGDYLAFVRQQQLPPEFLRDYDRLQRVYQVLGGNFRALEFFTKAVKNMNLEEEAIFLAKLKVAKEEIQTNMTLTEVIEQRSEAERELLHRLLAYQTSVPLDGVKVLMKVFLPSPRLPEGKKYEIPFNFSSQKEEADELIKNLLTVSLIEQHCNDRVGQDEYQLSPLVRSWLLANGARAPQQVLLREAAEFLLWQLKDGLKTSWEYLLSTHQALLDADLDGLRQRVVLDWIARPLYSAGRFQTLLDDWLQPLAEADSRQIRGDALGQMGNQYYHLGNYDVAEDCFKQSLAIKQELDDEKGEGCMLNNISQIYDQREDYDRALDYLKQSLAIRQKIGDTAGECSVLNNFSQIYQALEDYDKAQDYLKQSLAISQKIKNKSGEATALNNIATIAQNFGDYDVALDYFKRALAIQKDIGEVANSSSSFYNLGYCYHHKNEDTKAKRAWVEAYVIASEIGLASVLDQLNDLAVALDWPGGQNGWEKLAQQMSQNS